MKRFGSVLTKGLLIIALLAGTSIVLDSKGFNTSEEAHAALRPGQIRYYLECQGYIVLDLQPLPDSECWEAHTILNGQYYLTTVLVKDNQIIDHEDSSI